MKPTSKRASYRGLLSVNVTNSIRFVLDYLLPPLLRDSRWFMWPFFYVWFKGKNIRTYMEFKSLAYTLSDEEFMRAYAELDCLAKNRVTDTNEGSIQHAIESFDPEAKSIIDIGCGLGYFINRVAELGRYETFGCDVFPSAPIKGTYHQGNIDRLPFPDNAFDIVTCFHTLEHIRNLPGAIRELKRICRRQLIIGVPCQHYNYYTLDLHLNFFPISAYLLKEVEMPSAECRKFGSDWLLIGAKNPPAPRSPVALAASRHSPN